MTTDPSEKTEPNVTTQRSDSVKPLDKGASKLKDVPVFNCIVYVSDEPGGGLKARVATLSGVACSARIEREALGKIVSAFKQRVAELTQSGTLIPWIEPPSPIEAHERKRLIAVHL